MLIGVIAGMLVPAAAAQAAFVSVCTSASPYCGENEIFFSADDGETNNVTINREGNDVVLTDSGAPIQLFNSNGCTQPTPNSVRCPMPPNEFIFISARLHDGNDILASNLAGQGPPTVARVNLFVSGAAGNDAITGNDTDWGFDGLNGGTGDDGLNGRGGNDSLSDYDNAEDVAENTIPAGGANVFAGGAGNDSLSGGGGADTLRGEAGDDSFSGDQFDGFRTGPNSAAIVADKANDNMDGGDGFDRVLYDLPPNFNTTTGEFEPHAPTTPGANINLPEPGASTSNSGLSGEADTLTSIEDATGTDGADTINGSRVSNFLAGVAGNDTVTGNAGPDALSGNDGDDTLNAQDGESDRVDCGANAGDKANIDQLDATSGCPPVGQGTTVAQVTPPNIDRTKPGLKGTKTPKRIKAKRLRRRGYAFTCATQDPDTVRCMATLTAKVGNRLAIRSTAGEVILAEKRATFKGKRKMTLKLINRVTKRAVKKGKKLRLLVQVTDGSGNTSARRVVIKVT